MVRVPIQVQQGASVFKVSVQTQTIRQAVGIMAARHPGADVRVIFPIDPEEFFGEEPATRAYPTEREQPNGVAA